MEAPAPAATPTPTPTPTPVADKPRPTAAERLQASNAAMQNTRGLVKEMAAMKTLTRLLEAVYKRPGSLATDQERIQTLSTLLVKVGELGAVVARVAGEDYERSQYIRAMSMDAAVTLVCSSWEQCRDVDWGKLIDAAAAVPEINQAADEISKAGYRPVHSVDSAFDRTALSMHSAFWQVYSLGDTVNGITPRIAAEIVRDCAGYLHARDKFVLDNDVYVSWLQGSIRRMTDLICADLRAQFGAATDGPTPEDIQAVLAASRSGFEGVENYAQSMLEKPNANPVSRPADC